MSPSISETDFQANLHLLRERIESACQKCNREPSSITLLPVTKTHPVEITAMAWRAGLKAVGENRLQEAQEKRKEAPPELRWELIGHLQSNKTRQALETFDRIQSVDSVKLLRRLNQAADDSGKTLPILLQINTARDSAKFGAAPEDAIALFEQALGCEHLRVDGLMTIAPLEGGREAARRAFAALRELRDTLCQSSEHSLSVLSMGMTGDLEEAIMEGSTLIRVGSALFGTRSP